jgi:catechol 2,3-dioxygenase-like lactoylglutathione lyase family enzyme
MSFATLDYTVLVVEDLERSLAFYVDLLRLPLGHRSGPYAQLRTGATRLALFERAAMSAVLDRPLRAPDPGAAGFEIGFKVDDVDAAFRELTAAGAWPEQPPRDRPWGQRTAYLRDPDGHLVELVQDARV